MNKIDGSNLLPPRQLDQSSGSQQKKGTDPARTAEDSAPARSWVNGDSAVISDKARKLMSMRHAYDAGMDAIGREPDLREEKLAQVRLRLEQGFYQSSEVRDRISDGVLKAIEGMDEA